VSVDPTAASIEGRAVPAVASLRADQRARRQRLVDTAQRLMIEVDYERLQVKDVADAAGVALGTLYRYFSSKDHLFAVALGSWAAEFGDRLGLEPAGPTVERVKALYRRAVRAFERQPRVYDVLMQIQSSTDPLAVEAFRDFATHQSEAFGAALEPSKMSSSRRADVVSVMNAVLDVSLRSWRLGSQPISSVYTAVDRAADLILGRRTG
jgi:AcrR family transcriptional regulator